MTMDDVMLMLADIPPLLAGGWAAWFFVGLLLSIWSRREQQPEVTYSSSRHKSSPRVAVAFKPAFVAPKPVETAAAAGGDDAFADLERLLEPQTTHHIPGEDRPASMLPETPVLATPQSLP